MQRVAKPYSFGMELEINTEERGHSVFEGLPWIEYQNEESELIHEWITSPCLGLEFLRRATLFGHMLGFEYKRGEHDERAESFHLHIGRVSNIGKDYEEVDRLKVVNQADITPLLVAAQHLSRTGVHWRDQVGHYEDDAFSRRCVINGDNGAWLQNNSLGTIEIKLNENPAPLIPTILLPVLMDENFTADNGDMNSLTPIHLSHTVKEKMGQGQFDAMLSAAHKYWDNPTVSKLLHAFKDEATHIEVWEMAHKEFSRTNGLYTNMLRQVGA